MFELSLRSTDIFTFFAVERALGCCSSVQVVKILGNTASAATATADIAPINATEIDDCSLSEFDRFWRDIVAILSS